MHGATSGHLHVPACISRDHIHVHAGTRMDQRAFIYVIMPGFKLTLSSVTFG